MRDLSTYEREFFKDRKKQEPDVIDKADRALTVFWKHGRKIYTLIVCLLILVMIFSGYTVFTAKGRGKTIGTVAGNTVGLATGSVAGWQHGLDEGKQEGLSAKDVTLTISEQFKKNASLEVLKAHVIGIDDHKDGDKYKSITLFEGTLLFKVDLLNLSVVLAKDGKLNITIPQIIHEFVPDFEKSKELLEAQSFFNNGSTGQGVLATQNSFNNISENIESKLSNYATLKELAEQTAKERVAQIAEEVGINPHMINVVLGGDSTNEQK